jgi:hypothetical protein
MLSSCADRVVRARVGETEFCVPRSNYVTRDYWWIPRDLPKGDSFRFSIPDFFARNPGWYPMRDAHGKPLPVTGLVTADPPYLSWSKPPQGSHPFEEAQKPISAAERLGGGYYAVYSTARRDQWTVWEVPNAGLPQGQPATIADLGQRVATCRKYGRDSNFSSDCSRVILINKTAIYYRFAEENIPDLVNLDTVVRNSVLEWKCSTP